MHISTYTHSQGCVDKARTLAYMESVYNITIFGLEMMVKSGLKNIFEIPPCMRLLSPTS